MQVRSLRHVPVGLVLVAMGAPALADTTMQPGTACTSEGPVARSVTGLMVNKVASPQYATTYFHCPIVRTQPVSIYGGTATIHVNVRLNASADFECWVRSIKADNVTHDYIRIVFPSSVTGGEYDMRTASLSLPPLAPAALNMRCHVPNVSGGDAGILSYRVEQ